MPSGDRTSFDNHQNSSASFPAAAVSGLDHSMKSVEFADSNFRRLNDPMEVEERNWGLDDTARALRILKEIDSKVPEVSSVLMPDFLSFLKHDNPVIVRQSITTGTHLFCAILTEMALQLRSSSTIEGWLEEMWSWMLRFKVAVRSMLEPGSTGSRVLAAKFLEICFLLFTSDGNNSEDGNEWNFNISWLVQGHPTLNPTMLEYEASKILDLFLDILRSARTLSGSLVITVINCLASIAKKRPVHYDPVLSVLLEFDANFRTSAGCHAVSIQYAVRIALLGFLRCTNSSMFESRDKLLNAIRAKYSGEATDQFIRHTEKLARGIEHNSHDTRLIKIDPPSGQMFAPANPTRMRHLKDPGDSSAVSDDLPPMRAQFSAAEVTTLPVKVTCDSQDANDAINNFSLHTSPVSSDSSPAAKMIVAIGALLAEGDKGTQSLEILLSQIDADLFADIVIENMKHLPESPFTTSGRNGSMLPNSETSLPSVPSQTASIASSAASGQSSALPYILASAVVDSTGVNTLTSDIPSLPNLVMEFKRDPRRDPRRLDPRRVALPVGGSTIPLNAEGISDVQGLLDSSSKPTPLEALTVEDVPESLMFKTELELSESLIDRATEKQTSEETLVIINDSVEIDPSLEGQMPSDLVLSPVHSADQEMATSLETDDNEDLDGNMLETDHYPSSISMTVSSEDASHDSYPVPLCVELTNEDKKTLCKLAITRLIEDNKQIRASGCGQLRLPLLARLVAQIEADNDLVMFFRKHIILDYQHNKGHDLAMHVLYHLNAVTVSEADGHSSSANDNYEKFLLAIANTLIDSLPASDKSFCRLLCDAPFLTESAFKLLEDLCQLHGYENHRKDAGDGDRITQGLGAIWSLVLGRPLCRQSCLDIVLKCSVHSHDEVRAKAIRMVTNKLFLLPYAEENVEKFARSMLLSVVDQQVSEVEAKHLASREQMTETGFQESSISGLLKSELGPLESEPMEGIQLPSQSIPAMSFLHAYRQTSLFFALCTKKPSLLHLVFDVYGRAPKVVRQAIHRHVPGILRTLGPSYPELLRIISDPPEGSENLIMQVLELMTEESTPSADLIASVKHLYDTKLKDVSILIPMLSSLSKDEVLPIFPRLVELPLDKFQAALAHILQGSAHTGPALTPVEVLVAIHDVDSAKHGVPLKKIIDACTACFEQRTVFTQQVLAKSLSHMVEQVPLPMLFMRTAIQSIGNFPTLVDFVMEILSKLVSRQIWRMPKLWVGFLKLVSQTHPHSFNVLLQLPPPQLVNVFNKYSNLRGALAAYANQPNIRTSLSRQTLQVLGLNEPQEAPTGSSTPAAALQTSDTDSSARGATSS